MAHGTGPRVVTPCGSLRDGSRARVALEEPPAASDGAGATTELVVRGYGLPRLCAVYTAVPDATALRETVDRAGGVLLGTPNYNGSDSGVPKDALDHCGRDGFERTTVGPLEVAAGDLPGSATVHLRTVSRTLRAWTPSTEVAIPDSSSTVEATRVTDPDIAERTRRLGRELVSYAGVADSPAQTERTAVSSTDGSTDSDHTNT